MSVKKAEALIDNWRIVFFRGYKALQGDVSGHIDQRENPDLYPSICKDAITSRIVDSVFKTYAETHNTMYTLGEPA